MILKLGLIYRGMSFLFSLFPLQAIVFEACVWSLENNSENILAD